jgi:regulatory protein
VTQRDERERALDRAVRALARRDHSIHSLRAKLEGAGFSEQIREDVVATLTRSGYVDDARFAQARAAHLAVRGYGDEWIRGDLDAQGVPREAADEALAALAPERDRALEHAASVVNPDRALQTLTRRGFSDESLEGLLAEPIADNP